MSAFESTRLIIQPLAILFSALAFSVLPFWPISRRFLSDPLERLVASIAANFALYYFLEWSAYLLRLSQWIPAVIGFSAALASLISLLLNRSERFTFPWMAVFAWAALTIWVVGLQSQIVVYGATRWYGDWEEHYERSIFFLKQFSPATRFLNDQWILAARAPIFNSVIAWFMIFFGSDFWVYQILATLLNTLPLLPFALLLRDAARMNERKALLCGLVILGMAPFALQQELYTWNKFFAIAFVLAGIHFYWKGSSLQQEQLIAIAFAFFAIGILSHYMIVLYVIFFAAHFLLQHVIRQKSWKLAGGIVICCAMFLLTWFGYCFYKYGLTGTLSANSTFGTYIQQQRGKEGEIPPWSKVFQGNLVTTFVPYSWRHEFRGLGQAPRLRQFDDRGSGAPQESDSNAWEYASDLVQNIDTLPVAIGWAGVVGLVFVFFYRNRAGSDMAHASPGRLFWYLFILIGIPMNILASRDYMVGGTAHLNLQPFVFLIALIIISRFQVLPKLYRLFLTILFFTESVILAAAQIAIQSRPVPITRAANGTFVISAPLNFYFKYVNNYFLKLQSNCVFLSDHFGSLKFFMLGLGSLCAAFCVVVLWLSGNEKNHV